MRRLNRAIATLLALVSLMVASRVTAQPPYSAGPLTDPVSEEMMPWDVPVDRLEQYDAYWDGDGWPVDELDWDYQHVPAHSECGVCAPYPCSCHGIWTAEVEPIVLTRQSTRNVIISLETINQVQLVDRLSTKDVKFGIQPGLRLVGRRYLGTDLEERDYEFEVIYFGLFDWDETNEVFGGRINVGGFDRGSLLSQFSRSEVTSFEFADVHRINYGSELNNIEFNVRMGPPLRKERRVFTPGRGWTHQRGIGWSHTLLGGLRYMTIHEDFDFFSTTRIEQNNNFFANSSGDYRVKTRNRLLGIQIGGEISERRTRWEWGFRGKAGGFVNMGEQLTSIVFDDAGDPLIVTQTPPIFANDHEARAALVGEAGIFAVYRLRPAIALRAGYHLMWAAGLALAPEQLVFTFREPFVINQRGTLFYQGASLGLEASW